MRRNVVRLVLAIVCLCSVAAFTQEKSETVPPPKVLAVFREFVKPGKTGSAHRKTESAFVHAMQKAKWPVHYLAVDSLSGKTRTLFLTGYDSFADWEKDVLNTQKNAAFSAELDRAAAADGDLLSETDASAWVFNPDASLRPNVAIASMRYFDITVFRVKPGHERDWDELMKLVLKAYEQIPAMHWAAYDNVYGGEGNVHAFFLQMKSAAEVDGNLASNKDFVAAMGDEGMKRLSELSAAAIESSESNLFSFDPAMSYPADAWIKADPGFWKPKAAEPAKKAMEKTAETAKP